jgi:guanylate kinase
MPAPFIIRNSSFIIRHSQFIIRNSSFVLRKSFFSLHMAANKLLIITAPSGAGKTSITKHLMAEFSQLAFSVSAATRQPRGIEKDGVDYHFMSVDTFQQHIQQADFVEWEMVYEGKYYGTLKSELQRIWGAGKIPVLDIDVKGAIHVQQQYPQSSFSIFIDAPSIEELKRRLLLRGTETEASLAARINKASFEISFKKEFNEIIVNDNLEQACARAQEVVGEFLSR